MALLHKATVTPSKLELVRDWLPSQPWFTGEKGADLELVAAYRFDDPDGEVGVETLLVAGPDGAVLQVPLTYRGAPLAGSEAWLIGTMQHSVLGSRWIYDALGDPVYVATLTHAVRTGGQQAEVFIEIDGEMLQREPTAVVRGSGSAQDGTRVEIVRYPAVGAVAGGPALTGSWGDLPEPVLLVSVGA
jgi:hypothetical protein